MSFFKTTTLLCDASECLHTFSGRGFHLLKDTREAAAKTGWIYIHAVITDSKWVGPRDFCFIHNPNVS